MANPTNVLEYLNRINILLGGNSGTTSGDYASAQNAFSLNEVTGTSTIAAGKQHVVILLSPDFTGTFALGAGTAMDFDGVNDYNLSFEAPSGTSLPAISYTVTTGNFRAFGA